MANKRMLSKDVIQSDNFIDLSLSSQALYLHLSVVADDDGFVNNPKVITRIIGATDSDIQELITKEFIIKFDSGIIVLRHWLQNNYIRPDRYHETIYKTEKEQIVLNDNNIYDWLPNGYQTDTKQIPSIDKSRIDKSRIDKSRIDKSSTDKNRTGESEERKREQREEKQNNTTHNQNTQMTDNEFRQYFNRDN